MTHGSLFSGIGGFDLAARWMGWDNLFHVEFNPWCRKVLEYHFPESKSYTDVKQFDGTAWRGRVDVLSGGFPCQPYSAAGKRLGKDDERHLWPEMRRIISEVAPTYVVGENVRGLTNWNGGVVFEEVCADLEAAGYEVWTGILPAAGVGAPHRRDRVWFVAHAHGGADLRTPGRDAGPGASEGLSQRDEIRIPDQSSNVRNAADTNGQRGISLPNQVESEISKRRGVVCDGGERDAADTDGAGISQRADKWREPEPHNWGKIHHKFDADGASRNAADTDGAGFQERNPATQSSEAVFYGGNGDADAANAECDGLEHGTQPGSTTGGEGPTRQRVAGYTTAACWAGFPTQSPICGGDDGLPRRLDGITFSKWRNESIKAYGNAIVPQVAHALFRAIFDTASRF